MAIYARIINKCGYFLVVGIKLVGNIIFFMRLLCANRFFIWVNTICKWRFFLPHVQRKPSLLLNQIIDYLKNLWEFFSNIKNLQNACIKAEKIQIGPHAQTKTHQFQGNFNPNLKQKFAFYNIIDLHTQPSHPVQSIYIAHNLYLSTPSKNATSSSWFLLLWQSNFLILGTCKPHIWARCA